jgi:steroid delta-isomerase-like uncharacterized protein
MADTASLHRARLDNLLKRDWEGLRALYHPDYTYMDGSGAEKKGADSAVAVCEAYATAFPDLSLEIRSQYTPSADVSIIEYTARGTHEAELEGIPPTGKHLEVVVCNVIEARDGKIFRERDYYDTMAVMQQLGVAGV